MAARTDMKSVSAAWHALANGNDGEGWRIISIGASAPCELFAGRHLPHGEEALLIGFRSDNKISDLSLPQGHGFEVSALPSDPTGVDRTCLVLTRREGASLELFTTMTEDLIRLIESSTSENGNRLLQRFLARIGAWQDFMERHKGGVLSPEAEVGLFGELVVLGQLLDEGIPARLAVNAWQGPANSLQDFIFGSGAIEVKTTLSATAFPATVGSLEQLDETQRHPLFVAAVRLVVDASGKTLPSMADSIRDRLRGELAALDLLETSLIHAGLSELFAERYVRRLMHVSTTILSVAGRFPRLTPCNVNPAIRKARYELDLSSVEDEGIGLTSALRQLGVE